MKKSITMVFENCTIDGDYIIETAKEEVFEHRIMDIFASLNGETGLTITIKKATKTGDVDGIS